MLGSVLVYALPMVAGAQSSGIGTLSPSQGLDGIINMFTKAIGILVPILISLAVLFFLWGVFKYIKGDAAAKAEGAKNMLWGIIGIFVMVSVWGLVRILTSTFGTTADQSAISGPKLPSINY